MTESRVVLEGIRAVGRHGADIGERLEPQEFAVDLDVVMEVEKDSLADTVDYRSLADLARDTVSGTSFELLESLAQAVAEAIYDLSSVVSVTATVHKPSAAQEMGVDDVYAEATLE
jgi:dihydroneopterin aldolase